MPPLIDLSGQRFGRLTVLHRVGGKKKGATWLCRCDCGVEKAVYGQCLRDSDTRSCGCLNNDVRSRLATERNTKHGQSKRGQRSATYIVWCNFRHRTYKEPPPVCERWSSFENFFADMGPRPVGMTIDRIDNTKGYAPDNCRWASMKVQQNNRSNNRHITFGTTTMTLQQWSDATGIKRKTISRRLDKLDWSVERTLNTPVQK